MTTSVPYVLRLYIAGATPQSSNAVEALRAVCEEHLHGRYELRVIDVFQQPELAESADIVAVPTLVKHLPAPVSRVVGDLSSSHRIQVALDLATNGRDERDVHGR